MYILDAEIKTLCFYKYSFFISKDFFLDVHHLRLFIVTSPGGTNSGVQGLSSLQSLSTLGSLGNLSNAGGLQALSRVQPPLTPSLTPSLANHYREDLTQHVRAFPADILEKQVEKSDFLDKNS